MSYSNNPTLHIRQRAASNGQHAIRLTLRRPGQPDLEGEATIAFSLTEQEQADLRWYRAGLSPAHRDGRSGDGRAVRDFQHCQGCAADWEANAQRLIDIIDGELG